MDDFITAEKAREVTKAAEERRYKEFIRNLKADVICSAEHGEIVSSDFCFNFINYDFQEFVRKIEAFGFKVEGSWNHFYLDWRER